MVAILVARFLLWSLAHAPPGLARILYDFINETRVAGEDSAPSDT